MCNGRKTEFLVIDFWENEFNKSADEERAQSMPVLVSLFNTRLKLLSLYLDKPQAEERARLISLLRQAIAAIPTDAFSVKQALPTVGPWTLKQQVDCSHPRDASRHLRQGLVVEVAYNTALAYSFVREDRAPAKVRAYR